MAISASFAGPEQVAKWYFDGLKGLPVWFQMVVLTVILLLVIYFLFRDSDQENSFLPHTFDFKLFKIQLLASESRKARSFNTGYHKLQYVKVLSLTDRAKATAPVYTRCVGRLKPAERNVPVYDEAVYYTFERFAEKKKLGTRGNRSGGVIDPLQVVPWQPKFFDADTDAMTVPTQVDFKFKEKEGTDTFLSICHYQNGLQGREQSFTTRVYEKTNDARLIVDLSSIPGIADILVEPPTGIVMRGDTKAQQEADVVVLSPGVFTIACTDAMPLDTLNLRFIFDRTRAPRPATQTTQQT